MNDEEVSISVAHHEGLRAFGRVDPGRNPYRDDKAWAWDLGWRLGQFLLQERRPR